MSEKINTEKFIEGLAGYLPDYITARDEYTQMMAAVGTIDLLISKGYIKDEALFDLVEGNRKIREVMSKSLVKLHAEMENMTAVLKGETPKGKAKPTEPETDGTLLSWLEEK